MSAEENSAKQGVDQEGYWRRNVTGNFLMKGVVLARAEHTALV